MTLYLSSPLMTNVVEWIPAGREARFATDSARGPELGTVRHQRDVQVQEIEGLITDLHGETQFLMRKKVEDALQLARPYTKNIFNSCNKKSEGV